MTLLKVLKYAKTQFIRRYSAQKLCQEVSIPVPWGEVRGKWWGPTDSRPVLAVHGWQDNCGTFDRLIPLLNTNVGFLAVDFPGHGYSSRLPLGMYYYFTNYIITIKYIKSYLKWPKLSLMGHSMGGMASYVYTMLYPQNVDLLMCIDGFKPLKSKDEVGNMAKNLMGFLKHNEFAADDKEPPSYTLEEIERKFHEPNRGSIQLDVAHHIMQRNIAPSKLHPGKYYISRDPRLKLGVLLQFSEEAYKEHAQNITCPMFVTKSKGSSYYGGKEKFYEVLDELRKYSRDLDFNYVEGTHHAHLNNPEEIASLLHKFIERNNREDRSLGALKPEMIVNVEKDSRNADSCGTYNRIMPHLNSDIGFLTIDLPGQGYSSRLPLGMYYHFTTYLLTFEYLKSHFQWPKLSLMGNSMGASLCYTYTIMYPQNVDFLICFDSLLPDAFENQIGRMSTSITTFLKNNEFASKSIEEGPSYSLEEINKKLYDSVLDSIRPDLMQHVVKRKMVPSKLYPGRYYFTRDPRVKSSALLWFTLNELVERTRDVTCPVFLTKSKDSTYYGGKEEFYQVLNAFRNCEFHYVEGTHDAHINHPEEIAGLLCPFIRRHAGDRSVIGNVKPEVITASEEKNADNLIEKLSNPVRRRY